MSVKLYSYSSLKEVWWQCWRSRLYEVFDSVLKDNLQKKFSNVFLSISEVQ